MHIKDKYAWKEQIFMSSHESEDENTLLGHLNTLLMITHAHNVMFIAKSVFCYGYMIIYNY